MTNQTPAVYKSQLVKISDTYMPQIESQLQDNRISMSDYQRAVVLNAISSINELLVKEGLDFSKIDQSNITQILTRVATLELNASATPREIYFIKRNQKNKDGSAIQIIEMGIEGDGNDALLVRFGRGIKKVHKFWEVRESDEFTYPSYAGLDVTPPTWTPKGSGKVVRVVYPIEYSDGQVDYFISEREDVKSNLIAHMFNNLMWDKEKNKKKEKIAEFAAVHTLDEILDSEEMQTLGNISPAWKDLQSREAMLIRKMRNRITKKVPKDFSNAFIASKYEESEDDFVSRRMAAKEAEVIEEIQAEANTEVFDVPPIEAKQTEENSESNEDVEEEHSNSSVSETATSAEGADPYD